MILRPLAALCLGLVLLTGCENADLLEPPIPLGDFVLGHNIVVADNVEMVPISRPATIEEWEAAMIKAVDNRFGRYEGARIYNLGIAVNAYALAPPGIPVLVAPKSVLVVTANIWDDATGTKLSPEGKQFTIFESLSPEAVVGTGLTRTKAQQMAALSFNAVKAVEGWLAENPQWFTASPTAGYPVDGAPAAVMAPVTPRLPDGTALPAAAVVGPAVSTTALPPVVTAAPAN